MDFPLFAGILLRRFYVDPRVGSMLCWSIIYFAFLGLCAIAMRILFALAVYNDGVAKENHDATMWALLVGFLGLIPGIIYLCVRNSPQRKACCPRCGLWHNAYETVCPRCGTPNPTPAIPQQNPYLLRNAQRAKKLLIAGIICLVVLILVLVFGGIAISLYAASWA